MSHCLERLVLAASVPARAFEPKPQRDGRLLPQPRPALLAAMPSLSSADISAQSMPVPAAALLICLNLCHLLPACHVVTGVLLQTVINTASSTLNCARRPFGRANACSSPKHCAGRQPTACSTTLALFSSFVIATLLEAAYLLGSLHKTARRPSHLLQTVLEYKTHHSLPHLLYWAQPPILQMKRLYPKLLEPL